MARTNRSHDKVPVSRRGLLERRSPGIACAERIVLSVRVTAVFAKKYGASKYSTRREGIQGSIVAPSRLSWIRSSRQRAANLKLFDTREEGRTRGFQFGSKDAREPDSFAERS